MPLSRITPCAFGLPDTIPYWAELALGICWTATTLPPYSRATFVISPMTGASASIMSSASSTANGSAPTSDAAQSTAWPRPRAAGWRV